MSKDLEMSRKIAEKVADAGGRAYFVGGYVRDILLEKTQQAQNISEDGVKDIDIEVHRISPEALKEILSSLGEVCIFGASFGIMSLRGYNIDIAMPRSETCTGRGHRDFEVFIDPGLGEEKAAKRRDFTVNALMMDILTGEIIDFFDGREHLEKGIIRHVNDESFSEDPLRVLRGCGFAARFNFIIAPETRELCREIDISTLSSERIFAELEKVLLKSAVPSVFFCELRKMGKLGDWFSQLQDLIGIPQPSKHHPEGDVWNHTMLVLDKAASLRHLAKEPLYFMLSALCHDFGKVSTTKLDEKGELHSIGHEIEGMDIGRRFLSRITSEKELIKYVMSMIKLHMRPNILVSLGAKQKSYNKLFDDSVCPDDLILIAESDFGGKGIPLDYTPNRTVLLEKLNIFKEIMALPHVMGRDLIEAGLRPDKNFKALLDHAHKLRLAGVDKKTALKDVIALSKKL